MQASQLAVLKHGTVSTYVHHRCRCDECSAASSAYHRERYQRVREKRLAQVRERYVRERTAILTQAHARYRRNRARECAAARDRYLRDRPRRLELARRWAAANPTRVSARRARRREAIAANIRVVPARDWRRLCARYDDRCGYCGSTEPLTQDHIVPIVRGGRHSIGNLIPACRSCNSRKRHRTIMEWKLSRLARGDEWRPMWRAG